MLWITVPRIPLSHQDPASLFPFQITGSNLSLCIPLENDAKWYETPVLQTCLSLSVSRVSGSDLKDHFDMVYRMLADHAMDMLAVLL